MATKGYTLIEILVAVSVFFVVIAAPTGFFVASLKGQQKALMSQEMVDNVSYTLERVTRAVRMAKKETSCADPGDPSTCDCLKNMGYGYNYELIDEADRKGLRFKSYHPEPVCQEIFWDKNDNRLKEVKDGATAVYLTPSEIEVIDFAVNLEGEAQLDPAGYLENIQPRATLFLEAKEVRGQRPELQPGIKIQTTISQRNLDVAY